MLDDIRTTLVIMVYLILFFGAVGIAIGSLFAGMAAPLVLLYHYAL